MNRLIAPFLIALGLAIAAFAARPADARATIPSGPPLLAAPLVSEVAAAVERPRLAVEPGAPDVAPWAVVAAAVPAPEPPAAVAPAAPSTNASGDGSDLVAWAASLYEAVRSGRWTLVVGLILIGATYVARRWLLKSWAWTQTDRGGVLLAGLLSLVGAFANASMAGRWMDGRAFLAALETALVAMGGYAGIRRLLWPATTIKGELVTDPGKAEDLTGAPS